MSVCVCRAFQKFYMNVDSMFEILVLVMCWNIIMYSVCFYHLYEKKNTGMCEHIEHKVLKCVCADLYKDCR